MRVTFKKIMKFNPCNDRRDNFNKHCPNFSGSLEKFFSLTEITHSNKIWVALKLASEETNDIFELYCGFSTLKNSLSDNDAHDAFMAAFYAYTAYAGGYAVDGVAVAFNALERQYQLDALIYLIDREKK